jgi:hypothetical protein
MFLGAAFAASPASLPVQNISYLPFAAGPVDRRAPNLPSLPLAYSNPTHPPPLVHSSAVFGSTDVAGPLAFPNGFSTGRQDSTQISAAGAASAADFLPKDAKAEAYLFSDTSARSFSDMSTKTQAMVGSMPMVNVGFGPAPLYSAANPPQYSHFMPSEEAMRGVR